MEWDEEKCVCMGELGGSVWTECQTKDLRFYSASDGEQKRYSRGTVTQLELNPPFHLQVQLTLDYIVPC